MLDGVREGGIQNQIFGQEVSSFLERKLSREKMLVVDEDGRQRHLDRLDFVLELPSMVVVDDEIRKG